MRIRIAAIATLTAIAVPVASHAAPAPLSARGGGSTCYGERATIVGTRGADLIKGTNDRDVIVSFGGDDRILTRDGDDLVCAGGGADRIYGAAGADTIYGGDGADRLYGGGREDVLRGGHPGYNSDGDSVADTFLPGPGHDSVYGNPKVAYEVVDYSPEGNGVRVDLGAKRGATDRLVDVDLIIGTRFADRISIDHGRAFGLGGSDVLSGTGLLVDFIRPHETVPGGTKVSPEGRLGRDGDDTVRAGRGRTQAYLHCGRDRFIGGPGRDDVTALSGGDVLRGSSGWDRLTILRKPANRIDGTVRLDRGYLPGAKRTYFSGFQSYRLPMTKGGRVVGSNRPEHIVNFSLYAKWQGGIIFGRGGNDRLESDGGRLYGGTGNDELRAYHGGVARGGPGRDDV